MSNNNASIITCNTPVEFIHWIKTHNIYPSRSEFYRAAVTWGLENPTKIPFAKGDIKTKKAMKIITINLMDWQLDGLKALMDKTALNRSIIVRLILYKFIGKTIKLRINSYADQIREIPISEENRTEAEGDLTDFNPKTTIIESTSDVEDALNMYDKIQRQKWAAVQRRRAEARKIQINIIEVNRWFTQIYPITLYSRVFYYSLEMVNHW